MPALECLLGRAARVVGCAEDTLRRAVHRPLALLRAKVPPGKIPAPDTGQFDNATRTAIGDIQEANGRKRTGQVTRDFLDLLQ